MEVLHSSVRCRNYQQQWLCHGGGRRRSTIERLRQGKADASVLAVPDIV